MRTDVPSPKQLRGARLWCEATFAHPTAGTVTVPGNGGHRIWQADQWPSEQITGLQVPRRWGNEDLVDAGLIGSDGHRLTIVMKALSGAREWEWTIGTYLVLSATPDGPAVTINAALPVQAVIDHKYPYAVAVHKATTIPMIVGRLFNEDRLVSATDRGLTRPEVPVGFTIGEDRGATLKDLLAAWGAYAAATPYGDVGLYPVPTAEVERPALVFSSDDTVVDAPVTLDRTHIHNHVTVRVKDAPRVAEATQQHGKYAVDTYGYRTLPIETDAIWRFAEAQLMSLAELRKGLLRAVTVPVEAVPDYRVGPYEASRLHTPTTKGVGRLTGFDVPLYPGKTAVYHLGLEV